MVNHSKFLVLIGCMFLSACLTSCLSPVAQDEIVNGEDTDSRVSNLTVSTSMSSPWSLTRASEESAPLPIRYYLFDSKGICLDLKTVSQNDVSVVFEVDRDDYVIYALCGEMTDAPTKETAKQNEFLNFVPNADVCLGNATVSVSNYGMNNNVQIKVNHIFSVVSLSISGVPESVTGISATFNDLYEAISLDGVYDGTENAMKSLDMSSEDQSLWILPDTYLYPSSTAQMPVTLKITSEDGSTQLIQTSTEYILKSGVKNNLSAQFQSLSNVSAGVIVENGWQTILEDIDFWGEDNSGINSEQNADNVPQGTDPAPENTNPTPMTYVEGEQFGNTKTFILSKNEIDGKTHLLLCGLMIGSIADSDDIDELLANYNESVNSDGSLPSDLTWRVPVSSELSQIFQYSASDISEKMSVLNDNVGNIVVDSNTKVCFMSSNLIKTCKYNAIGQFTNFQPCSCFPVATLIIE